MKCLYSEKALNSIFFELWFVVLAYCYDTKFCKKATVKSLSHFTVNNNDIHEV